MTAKKKPQTKVDELKEALKKKKAGQKVDEVSGEFDQLSSQLKTAEEEAKEHYDKLLRVMAELDNFKKRSDREKQDLVKYSNEKLVTDLLPVLDDLDRVLEHVPEGASKELVDFVSGVQLVSKHFVATLQKYGLKEIKTESEKFNPELHEAVSHVSNDDVESDHIIEQHRKGYVLNGRVIRAAMVSVSKGRLH